MKKILFLLVMIGFISCNQKTQVLEDSAIVKKYFNESDITELNKIIAFVDDYVLEKSKSSDINEAYHWYFDTLFNMEFDDMYKERAIDQEYKYQFLFNLDSLLFNKIWIKYSPGKVVTKDTTLENPENFVSIDFNPNDDYMKVIEAQSKDNEFYKSLVKATKQIGDLSPVSIAKYLTIHQEFDYNNIEDRLWAAIFILTIEESVEKKVERYLNKQT